MSPNRPRSTTRTPKPLKARAIALLARREYSRADLRRKLAGGGERGEQDLAALDAVLDELSALGFLSDARFASEVVRGKAGRYSKRAIGHALEASGISAEAANAALEGVDVDDHDALVALWRRRFGKAPADDREKSRQVRYLQSRGFSLSAIFKLLRDPPLEDERRE